MDDTSSRNRVLLATTSFGKAQEYREILAALAVVLVTPADLGLHLEIGETADSFRENAFRKAWAYFQASGLTTVAEDSGLEVDALGGEPGLVSARWEGVEDGPEKNRLLLERLAGVPPVRRSCRYVCNAVLVVERDEIRFCDGYCYGFVALEPAGTGGFGFDPVFYLPEYGKTMAELSSAVKNQVSHRARAAECLRARLREWLEAGALRSC